MIDGKMYENNSEIPSDNACRICECVDSEMVCAEEICEDPEEGCVLMPPSDDECCNYKCDEDNVATVSAFLIFIILSCNVV